MRGCRPDRAGGERLCTQRSSGWRGPAQRLVHTLFSFTQQNRAFASGSRSGTAALPLPGSWTAGFSESVCLLAAQVRVPGWVFGKDTPGTGGGGLLTHLWPLKPGPSLGSLWYLRKLGLPHPLCPRGPGPLWQVACRTRLLPKAVLGQCQLEAACSGPDEERTLPTQ